MILLTGGQDSSETNHVVLKEGFLTQNCAARDPDSPLGFAIFFLCGIVSSNSVGRDPDPTLGCAIFLCGIVSSNRVGRDLDPTLGLVNCCHIVKFFEWDY